MNQTNNTGNFLEKNKSGIFIAIGVIILVVCTFLVSLSVKSQARRLENAVETAAADITIVEKERTDKLDLLFPVVMAEAGHELEVINSITDSRKKIEIDSENGNLGGVSNTLDDVKTDITLLVESYPEISATQGYQEFMDACTISESKISGHRVAYNAAVKEYNNFIDGAINEMLLNFLGYDVKDLELLDYENRYEDPKEYNWEG
mgnify:CR=1 FL=1